MTQAEQDLLYIQLEIAKEPKRVQEMVEAAAAKIRNIVTDDIACMALALVGAELSARLRP